MTVASVIICAYTFDRLAWTDRAVHSALRQSLSPGEVVLVIDHNPELFALMRARYAGVTVIENASERGLSGARNTGVRAASGDIIAFLDDDAEAEPDWLAKLLRWYADDDVVGVGGSSVPRWDTGRPSWFPVEFDWVVGCSYRGQPERPAPVRNLIGSNMSLRRSVFEKVGLFNASIGRVGSIPIGDEETELCIRATRDIPRSKIMFDPDILVWHTVPQTRSSVRYFVRRCIAEGLSKAVLRELAGAGPALSSERSYLTRTLPVAVVEAVQAAVAQRNPAILARAAAISAGVSLTVGGYLTGVARLLVRPQTGHSSRRQVERL